MLELREVVKHFWTGDVVVPAVDGVSLAVEPAEVVALYGPSGSGKTTLLLLAAGMTVPDAGEVLFKGRSVGALSARDGTRFRRSELGFVLQQFHLIPCMPAIDNAALKLVAAGISRRAARKQAAGWLERVGLAERRDHPPEKLSTGERQRVAIARALANNPSLILADEPTGNLDTSRAQEILAMLADISHREGVAVVIVTHDPEAAVFADRVHTLRDGKLIDAPPRTAAARAVSAIGDAG